MLKNAMKNNALWRPAIFCDDLYYYCEGDDSWGSEIIMGRIEKKWVFRVGSEKHEADNCVIVNLSREARMEEIQREISAGWEIRDCGKDLSLGSAYTRKYKMDKVLSTYGACGEMA